MKHAESRRRVIFSGGFLVAAIVAAVVVTIVMQRESDIDAYRIATTNLSNGMAQQTSAWFGSIDLALKDVQDELLSVPNSSPDQTRQTMRGDAVSRLLEDRQKYLPGVDTFAIADENGVIAASSGARLPTGTDVHGQEFFGHFRSESDYGVFVSAPEKEAVSGEWISFVSRRLTDHRGAFLGVALAQISLTYLEDFYRLAMPARRSVEVFLRDGVLICRYPHREADIGRQIPSQAPWHAIVAAGGGAYVAPGYFDGMPVLAVVRPLDHVPIVVEAAVSEADALAGWYQARTNIVIGGTAAIISVVLLLRLLSAQFHRLEESEKSLEQSNVKLRKLAADLQQAQATADEANQTKSRFLAAMSHELRTPLNAVLGFSDVIRNELWGPVTPAKYREYADFIYDSGQLLLALIDDVLDLSKIEAGKMDLQISAVSTRDLAKHVARLTAGAAAERRVAFEASVAHDCATIRGDERRVRQILLNLISNAIKFTPAGGRVRLEISGPEGGGVDLVVSDTGIGMTPEEIKVALQPYGQVRSELAVRAQGTGLGLPLVRALAEQHGGSLAVASVKGAGTTITVHLPGRGSSVGRE